MFKNYLTVALRGLVRNKTFSLINILGLALGMACSLIIMLWVNDERSIDAFHKNHKQLYSVYERQFYENKIDAFHTTPGLMSDEMKRVFPEVQYASGFAWINENTFEVGEKAIKEKGSYAGADFFKMFSYPLLEGDAQTALSTPSGIAVSRNMATSFFGGPDQAINKIIRFENKKDFKITAVFDNLNNNVSQKFDFLINWYAFLDDNQWSKDWDITINNGPRTYIMLRPGVDATAFESRIKNFLNSYFKEQHSGFRVELGLQRFDEMYLYPNFKNGMVGGGRIEYVRLFSIIAVFILLIACVNFMNLTTARFMKRAKEIGVRKVAGAVRSSLIKQFIGEAILLSFISVITALAIVVLLLPTFNNLVHKEIYLPWAQIYFWVSIVCLAIITGIVAGSYPAFFLSSFDPIKVLKGSLKAGPKAAFLRKGLVVFQFVLSIILIIGTIVVSQQVNYIQTKNLGYNKNNTIYVPLDGNLINQYKVFKERALDIPGVKFFTNITQIPTQVETGTYDVSWDMKGPDEKPLFIWASVGYDFTKTLGLQVLQGRDFSKDFPTDSSGYIINESALQQLHYTNPVGKPLIFWGKKGTIIGVVKDFHFNSLHDPIRPLIMRLNEKETWGNALIKIEPEKTKQALQGLGSLVRSLNPKFPFTYKFLDEAYQNLYQSEEVVGKLSSYFAFLAIFISCLGLLGLVMFTAEQRTKEIGIRKVLGANAGSVFLMLSKDFIGLVLLAFVVASPLGWWAMHNWLADFAYRIDIGWQVFALAGLMVFAIALFTVSFQSIKAANANPVKSLRSE